MKKTIFGCLGVAAVAFALLTPASAYAQFFNWNRNCDPCAAVECDPCDPCGDFNGCDPCDAVCGPKAGKWFLGGHIEAGIYDNVNGEDNVYDGGTPFLGRGANWESGNSLLLQNARLTSAQINQVYLSAGRSVDGRRGWDFGGTVDFTWGSDAYSVQAAGMEYATGRGQGGNTLGRWGTGDYYSAFAQAYFEMERGRLNVKAGKFYLPFGSDSYKSTENFFYTWSLTNLITPNVGSGAYATYKVNNRLSVVGGLASFDEFGETSESMGMLGGFNYCVNKNLKLHYYFLAGENTYSNNLFEGEYRFFINSLGMNYQMSKRLKYTFDWTYREIKDITTSKFDRAYGLNNEFTYCLNKRWSLGLRAGMLKLNELAVEDITQGAGLGTGTELYTVGFGANWKPNKWLTVKPEVRYDWTDKPATMVFNNEKDAYQLSGGVSAVMKF